MQESSYSFPSSERRQVCEFIFGQAQGNWDQALGPVVRPRPGGLYPDSAFEPHGVNIAAYYRARLRSRLGAAAPRSRVTADGFRERTFCIAPQGVKHPPIRGWLNFWAGYRLHRPTTPGGRALLRFLESSKILQNRDTLPPGVVFMQIH